MSTGACPKVNIYSINEFEDYYYGYMVPDAGCLKYFSLHLYDEGFVLQMPVREKPEEVPEFVPSPKLFHVLKESVQWGGLPGHRDRGGAQRYDHEE